MAETAAAAGAGEGAAIVSPSSSVTHGAPTIWASCSAATASSVVT